MSSQLQQEYGMEDSKGDEPAKKSGKIRIVVELHREDADRLRKAFESGMLDHLGIRDVNVLQPSESSTQQKKWVNDDQSRQRRQAKPDDETPPFPG
jgi:hypothetical protein